MRPRVYLAAFACAAGVICNASQAGDLAASSSSVSARYECLWWSPEQMRDLNPNQPPPKTTLVSLTRWEYSDPVGVPHPDSVTLVIRADSRTAPRLSVRTTWLAKGWSEPAPLPGPASIAEDGAARVLRYDVPVGDYITAHEPSRLRSTILLDGRDVADADLPIQVGD